MVTIQPRRIVIWGTVASGKTTLANQLNKITSKSNVIDTDELFYRSNRKSAKGLKLIISEIKETLLNDSWIIDGNLDERISRKEIAELADLIIIFHYPVSLLLKRLILRESNEILNIRKPLGVTTWQNFLHSKLLSIQLFFESIKIIKNYNRNFVYQLYSMIIDANMYHKTFIVSSRKNLEKLIAELI